MGFLFGVGLVSLALIATQVVLTRIFSCMVWYHLGFLAISLAMLGFALGGLILLLRPSLPARSDTVPACSALFALSLALGTACIYFPHPIQGFFSAASVFLPGEARLWGALGYLGLLLAILVVGFACSGTAIAAAITQRAKDIGRVYFANLAGSGVGGPVAIAALSLLGAFKAMLLVLCAAALSPLLFGGARKLGRPLALSALLLLAAGALLLLFADGDLIFARSILKRGDVTEQRRIYREWNAFSVVDFYRASGQSDMLKYEGLWGLSKSYRGERPEPIKVMIDSWAITSINRVDRHTLESEIFDFLPANLAYAIKDRPRVLVMGAGGGIDVLSALHYGARGIKAVEINPSIVSAVRTRFADFAGHIYSRPGVGVIVGEGRHVLDRDRERYDLIQLSGVDTLSGAQASAFAFSESYLYTQEAFDEFLEHLRPDGVLSFLRFAFPKPREMLRLMTTATEALERAGAERPAAHLAAVHSGYQHFAGLLVKRSPFTRAEMDRLDALVERNGFYFLYRPDRELGHEYERYIAAPDRKAYYNAYPYRIRPVSDDDPFFFNYTKFRSIFQPPEADFYLLYWIGQTILFYGAALVGGFALLFFGLPWLQRSIRERARAGGSGFLAYFLCLGVAFMFVEIVLMQRFTLFLGQPVYALSLVLGCLLVFGGSGSWFTRRLRRDHPRALLVCFSALLGALVCTHLAAFLVFDSLLHASLAARVTVSVLLLGPVGFMMGFPFPLAVRLADRECPLMVPWGWAVNAYGGVLGSFLSVIIAIYLGFTVVYVAAVLIYALAALLLVRLRARYSA